MCSHAMARSLVVRSGPCPSHTQTQTQTLTQVSRLSQLSAPPEDSQRSPSQPTLNQVFREDDLLEQSPGLGIGRITQYQGSASEDELSEDEHTLIMPSGGVHGVQVIQLEHESCLGMVTDSAATLRVYKITSQMWEKFAPKADLEVKVLYDPDANLHDMKLCREFTVFTVMRRERRTCSCRFITKTKRCSSYKGNCRTKWRRQGEFA
jgi:hypothetical protein